MLPEMLMALVLMQKICLFSSRNMAYILPTAMTDGRAGGTTMVNTVSVLIAMLVAVLPLCIYVAANFYIAMQKCGRKKKEKILSYHGGERVEEADECDGDEDSDELVRVLVELEVRRWRVEYRSDQRTLVCPQARPDDLGQHWLISVLSAQLRKQIFKSNMREI